MSWLERRREAKARERHLNLTLASHLGYARFLASADVARVMVSRVQGNSNIPIHDIRLWSDPYHCAMAVAVMLGIETKDLEAAYRSILNVSIENDGFLYYRLEAAMREFAKPTDTTTNQGEQTHAR